LISYQHVTTNLCRWLNVNHLYIGDLHRRPTEDTHGETYAYKKIIKIVLGVERFIDPYATNTVNLCMTPKKDQEAIQGFIASSLS